MARTLACLVALLVPGFGYGLLLESFNCTSAANDMATIILGEDAGITITDPVIIGDCTQFGKFSDGTAVAATANANSHNTAFLNSGIVLSTGRVADAAGPNAASNTATDIGSITNYQDRGECTDACAAVKAADLDTATRCESIYGCSYTKATGAAVGTCVREPPAGTAACSSLTGNDLKPYDTDIGSGRLDVLSNHAVTMSKTGACEALPGCEFGGAGPELWSVRSAGINKLDDPAVLQFSFTLAENSEVHLKYIFASEEYNEYTRPGGFPDTFGLFVDGVNIARAADGRGVSVGNINCGYAAARGTSFSGDEQNCPQYVNNDFTSTDADFSASASASPVKYDIEYDGFTVIMTASMELCAGRSHHMRLAIADANDGRLDSSVFISAKTFSVHHVGCMTSGALNYDASATKDTCPTQCIFASTFTGKRPCVCDANEHVVNNRCVACASGYTNAAGDNANLANTDCDLAPESPNSGAGGDSGDNTGLIAGLVTTGVLLFLAVPLLLWWYARYKHKMTSLQKKAGRLDDVENQKSAEMMHMEETRLSSLAYNHKPAPPAGGGQDNSALHAEIARLKKIIASFEHHSPGKKKRGPGKKRIGFGETQSAGLQGMQ